MKKDKGIYLYGAGGHAKVIMDILEANGIPLTGIADDNLGLKYFMGYEVSHQTAFSSPIIISIGLNPIRRKVAEKLYKLEATFGKAFHPTAIISPSAVLGEGTVIMQGAIVQACTRIGKHCIINTAASVDHDCIIGNYAHISPHATLCGNVTVGEATWIGAGAIVLPGVKIGENCIIGAGAVVCKDIPDHVTAVGNPCKIIKKNERE